MTLLHLAISAFDVSPLGSGTSPAILKIGRLGGEADSTLVLAGDVLGQMQ